MFDPNDPTNLIELQDRFGSERKCMAYLFSKINPAGLKCARCVEGKGYELSERAPIECAGCGYQASLTAGTMLHGTRRPLKMWFRAVFEFVSRKHGCNAMDLQGLFGLCRKVAWAWLQKIRDDTVHPEQQPLSGEVEIDETHIGASVEGVHGRNRGSKKHIVIGTVEVVGHDDGGKCCGRGRLAKVDSGSAEQLQVGLVASSKLGATTRVGGCTGYDGLEHAYRNRRTVIRDCKTASIKFPHVHQIFAIIKRLTARTYPFSWGTTGFRPTATSSPFASTAERLAHGRRAVSL